MSKIKRTTIEMPFWMYEFINRTLKKLQTREQRIIELINKGRDYENHICDFKEQHVVKFSENKETLPPTEQIIDEVAKIQDLENGKQIQIPLISDQVDPVTETNNTQFIEFWNYYPEKVGKSKALKVFERETKSSPKNRPLIWNALYCYLKYIKGKREVNKDYPYRNGDTWIRSWNDWLFPDHNVNYNIEQVKQMIDSLSNRNDEYVL